MTTDMTYNEYMSYASEIGTLEHILEGMPEDMRIERIGLQSRLNRVRNRLEGVPVPPRPRQFAATFGGAPIVHAHGIDANFGAAAVNLFSDTIRLTTAGLTGELKATGQIPRSALSQPIITDVAIGSFGFVMDLPEPTRSMDGISYPELAVKLVQELLRLAKEGDDENLSSAVADIHPRALIKIMGLLDFMRKNQAYFAINYQDNQVRFDSSSEIVYAANRLTPSSVEPQTRDIVGTFIGVVPGTWAFQIDTNDGESIHGRVSPEAGNAYQIGIEHSNRQVRAQVRTVRIGRGAPRHTLVSVVGIPDQEEC